MIGLSLRKAAVLFLCIWGVTLLFLLLSTPNFHGYENPLVCKTNQVSGTVEQKKIDPFPKELSFILLNWNRLSCLKTIVKNAQRYSAFITEIVIGNNNPDILLKPEDFDSPSIPVRVFNFPQNQYFFARYELCLMSTGKYCYMQDDDWDNKYIKTLYANFLRSPHLLHTNTNAYVHYLTWSWTFFEPAINLHGGFSWLGTGAIAGHEQVSHFVLSQLVFMDRKDIPLADMYFATWFNQVPYQLQNDLVELDSSQNGFSNQEGGILRNKAHITKSIRTLYKQLSANSDIFQKEESHPTVEERYIKSSCRSDDCLFMTSLHSFPNPRAIIYEMNMDVDDMEKTHSNLFKHNPFVDNPYNFAVDNNSETAWISLSDVNKGDFFGLDLLEPLEKEAIYLIVKHDYQEELELEVSLDGENWSSKCTWEFEKKDTHFGGTTLYRYTMTSSCMCSFRFLRFTTTTQYPTPLQVYDISTVDITATWSESQISIKDCDLTFDIPINLREIDKDPIPVTLVLLNWKRPHNLGQIFDHLAKYKVINEYIIWNNNNEHLIQESTLFPKGIPEGVSVRIINSPQNLHDYGKYLGCSMATNDYCYFQDDDWLNKYFQSQYTSFLRYPETFHSMTIPIIYLEHRRWNIYNSAVKLHAGFSWLGVGSFTSKKRVQKFLHQCSLFNLSQDELLQADIFFSYFSNDYPLELSTIPSQLDQSGAWSASVDQWGIVYKRLQIAATKVYTHLAAGNKGDLISIAPPVPSYENRDIRAPCKSDECLFLTNSYPFPHPSRITYDATQSIKEQESAYNALDWPSNWFWDYNSYERAVDQDPFTCWTSYHNGKRGDYYGLDLLKTSTYPIFTITLDHEILLYDLFISANTNTWIKTQYIVDKSWSIVGPLVIYTISLDQHMPFRFIKLAKIKPNDEQPLSVYEFYLGSLASVNTHFFTASKVINPSFEGSLQHWTIRAPQIDFAALQNEKGRIGHTGSSSLVFSTESSDVDFVASQIIDVSQTSPKMIVVSAYSKAENALNKNHPAAGYSISLDATYVDGQTDWAVQTSVYNYGSHDWQPMLFSFKPPRNLKSVTVVINFSKFTGTVWFDDVTVQEDL